MTMWARARNPQFNRRVPKTVAQHPWQVAENKELMNRVKPYYSEDAL